MISKALVIFLHLKILAQDLQIELYNIKCHIDIEKCVCERIKQVLFYPNHVILS